jgi:hypothetical protein
MNKSFPFMAIATLLALQCSASRGDEHLVLTLQAHSERIVFGDPIYLEWSLTNRGTESVTVPALDLTASYASILAHDRDLDLTVSVTSASGAGGSRSVEIAAGKTLKKYGVVLLPSVGRIDHPFWKPIQAGKEIALSCVYARRPGVRLGSRSVPLRVDERDKEQTAVLARWRGEMPSQFLGPSPNDLVLLFPQLNLNRSQTTAAREALGKGELADLLLLTQQLQEMYVLAEDDRGPRSRLLIEWLQKQPAIKREALLHATRGLSEAYQFHATEAELNRLIGSR